MIPIKFARMTVLSLCMLSASCVSTSEKEADIFAPCEDRVEADVLADSECAFVSAPLNYGADDTETISLFVRKFAARESQRGTLILLAGGPGESGASFYADIEFFRDVFADFDLIVPDHRGTGYSTKLCEPEETELSEGGFNLVGDEWGSCFGQFYGNTPRAHAFNLQNAAHDVETLIETLKPSGKVYLYGVSYGTSLAIETAKYTDADLSGVILDSLTPRPEDHQFDLGHRSQVTNTVGQTLLQRCSAAPSCPLGPNASDIYADLLARIDAGETVMGLDVVPNGDLRQLMGLLLDVPTARNQIPVIIDAMASNNQQAVEIVQSAIQAYETFLAPILEFEQATSSIPLTSLMSGSEFNARTDLTPERVAEEKSELAFTSPLPRYLAENAFPLYEPTKNMRVGIDLPPMLVLQGTLDPKTPYQGAVQRVKALEDKTDIAMITLIDAPHVAYFTSQTCIREPLQAFVEGVAVSALECAADDARLPW